MEMILNVLTLIGGFFAAVAAHFIAHDAYSSAPRYARRLIELAVQSLPTNEQERYREQWMADLDDHASVLTKFQHALGCWIGSGKVAAVCREANSTAIVRRAVRNMMIGSASASWQIALDPASAAFLLLTIRHYAQKLNEPIDYPAVRSEVEARLGPIDLRTLKVLTEMMIEDAESNPGGNSKDDPNQTLSAVEQLLNRLGWDN